MIHLFIFILYLFIALLINYNKHMKVCMFVSVWRFKIRSRFLNQFYVSFNNNFLFRVYFFSSYEFYFYFFDLSTLFFSIHLTKEWFYFLMSVFFSVCAPMLLSLAMYVYSFYFAFCCCCSIKYDRFIMAYKFLF